MQVTPIPCLTDNYAYIINDINFKNIGVVDPSEAQPIIAFLKKKNLKLNYILNTHNHFYHVGGNIELKKSFIVHMCRFGVLYHSFGKFFVTGIVPFKSKCILTFQ